MTTIDTSATATTPYSPNGIGETTNTSTATTSAHTSASSASTSSSSGTLSSLATAVADATSQTATTSLTGSSTVPRVLELMMTVIATIIELLKTLSPSLPGNSKPSANGSSTPGGAQPTTGSPTGPTSSAPTEQAQPGLFTINKNDAGVISVRTRDGYTIRAEGRDEAWSITGPDGKTTRVWGDPHVHESDGDKWDFRERSTFVFGRNKITVELVPAPNGETITSRITIYSGNERVTIGGINTNKPEVLSAGNDGKQHDDSLADGHYYDRTTSSSGEQWIHDNGTKRAVIKGR